MGPTERVKMSKEKTPAEMPDFDAVKKRKQAADAEYAAALAMQSGPMRKAFLEQLVALHELNSQITEAMPAWRLPGIIRTDLIVHNSVAALGRATAAQVNEDVAEALESLGEKTPLAFIKKTLEEKSKLKDAEGKKLRRLFTHNDDDTYSVIE